MLIRARLPCSMFLQRASLRAFSTTSNPKAFVWRTTKNYVNNHKHDIFEFKIDHERKEAVVKQLNLHGGLNELLTKNGHCPLESCKQAIERAFALGLIGMHTYKECIEINKKSNNAKHKWR